MDEKARMDTEVKRRREREAKYEAIPSLSRSDIGIRKHGAHGVAGTGIRG